MQQHKNILLLTSKTGGGHVSLAEALQDLLLEAASGREEAHGSDVPLPIITIVDPQPSFFHSHYRVVSRYALWLWATEFQFFDTPGRALFAHRAFTTLVGRQLNRLLDTLQPDLIITTYPFLTYEVMRELEKHSSTVPLVALFSDANNVHASWLTEHGAAATLAPTRETYKQALLARFALERLHLVGWPVRSQFTRAAQLTKEEHNELLTRCGLVPDRFTLFLQGGNDGAAHVDRVIGNIHAMHTLTRKVQIILAVGTNHSLYKRYKNTDNLTVLPYTKEIARYMAASDVIMGKAGPNILFESVMLGKPFVATSYIPGQEHENLMFIQHHSLGWVALHRQEQQALLTSLVYTPDQSHMMFDSINTYRTWNVEATARIVPLIHSLF